jgi:hypothetical protein
VSGGVGLTGFLEKRVTLRAGPEFCGLIPDFLGKYCKTILEGFRLLYAAALHGPLPNQRGYYFTMQGCRGLLPRNIIQIRLFTFSK